MASFNDETAKKLLTQVEFYFSDSNLPTDAFLSKEVTKSKDGRILSLLLYKLTLSFFCVFFLDRQSFIPKLVVSLPLVCSFSRMRNLLGLGNIRREDIPEIIVARVANLLRTSDFLKVSHDGLRIGRGTKLSKPEKVLKQVHRRTLAASPFEYTIKMEDVASFFSQYAKVNSVRLPHHIGDKQHFSGIALVEFSSVQDTQHILRQTLVYAGADLVLIPKSDFDSQRETMIKKLGKSGSSPTHPSHNEFPRGQAVKFTLKKIANGVINKEKPKSLENKIRGKEDMADSAEKVEGNDSKKESGDLGADKKCASLCTESRETDQFVVPPWDNSDGSEVLKDVFQRFGSVKHIEYTGGLDSGYVCFIDSETAMKARAAVEFVGGLVVKNKFSVALEAMNGEMEREVWKRLSSAEREGGWKEEDDEKEESKAKKARKEP